jgi:hypothetical protein
MTLSQFQGDIPEVVMNEEFVINMDTILSGYKAMSRENRDDWNKIYTFICSNEK